MAVFRLSLQKRARAAARAPTYNVIFALNGAPAP
jgi:hypothetical protein